MVASANGRYYCTFKHVCGDVTSETRCSAAICQDLAAGLPYLTTVPIYDDVALPPATVAAQVNCAGANGWCRDSATVHISGSEPVKI